MSSSFSVFLVEKYWTVTSLELILLQWLVPVWKKLLEDGGRGFGGLRKPVFLIISLGYVCVQMGSMILIHIDVFLKGP